VERSKLTPAEAIQMLLKVGGVPVLAHPAYLSELEAAVSELKAAGLLGMEVYYANFTPEKVRYLERLAAEYDIIPCGGSDFHGLGNTGEALPGSMGPPLSTVERLEEAARKVMLSNRT
jgi:predicted metal-dependent phosphoesterase TrpH